MSSGATEGTGPAAPSAQPGGSVAADTSAESGTSAEAGRSGDSSRAGTAGQDTARGAIASSSEARPLTGMYVYLADAALFTDCATGTSYPVAQEGAAARLERAYLDARHGPGEPLLMTIRGRVARRPGMEGGFVNAVVVDSVVGSSPGKGCGGGVPDRPLEGIPWVLVGLPGAPSIPEDVRATLVLDAEAGSVGGSTGCSLYSGTYRLAGGQLDIAPTEVIRQGCAPALTRLETDFLEALRVTGSYRVRGDTLELLGEAGVVARLAAES